MIYVGIDIAKLNHFASVLSSDGKVLVEPFKFTNDNDGFCMLLSVPNFFDKDYIIIGLESASCYHYGTLDHCAFKLIHIIYKMLTENFSPIFQILSLQAI